MFQEDIAIASELSLFTDASNTGMGGVFQNKWFSAQWPHYMAGNNCSTNFQEIFAIFTTIWASKLRNKQLLIHCDNETVVSIINSGTCKSSNMMTVVRKIFFICAKHNISIFSNTYPDNLMNWLMRYLVCRSLVSWNYTHRRQQFPIWYRTLFGTSRQ